VDDEFSFWDTPFQIYPDLML